MRISDWSSDVCSSDLHHSGAGPDAGSYRPPSRTSSTAAPRRRSRTVTLRETPCTLSSVGSAKTLDIASLGMALRAANEELFDYPHFTLRRLPLSSILTCIRICAPTIPPSCPYQTRYEKRHFWKGCSCTFISQ